MSLLLVRAKASPSPVGTSCPVLSHPPWLGLLPLSSPVAHSLDCFFLSILVPRCSHQHLAFDAHYTLVTPKWSPPPVSAWTSDIPLWRSPCCLCLCTWEMFWCDMSVKVLITFHSKRALPSIFSSQRRALLLVARSSGPRPWGPP